MGDSRKSGSTAVPYRVLVADDDADACAMLSVALERTGFSVTKAHDGKELYDLLVSVPSGHFRAVVTDQKMPHLFGVEVLARAGSRAPFVILTGFAPSASEASAERYGAAAFLTKPVVIDELIDIVERIAFGERTPPRLKAPG
jgi:DNA-binding NtrC family response regulator